MRKLLLLILFTISLQVSAQVVPDVVRTAPTPASGGNRNNRAQSDANLYIPYSLRIPRASTYTLNGAKDSIGYIMFNTTSQRLGVYRGSGIWDTYFVTPGGLTTQYVRGDGSLATFPDIPNLLPSNNTWTGTNEFKNTTTFKNPGNSGLNATFTWDNLGPGLGHYNYLNFNGKVAIKEGISQITIDSNRISLQNIGNNNNSMNFIDSLLSVHAAQVDNVPTNPHDVVRLTDLSSLQSKIFLKATDYPIIGDSTTDNTVAMSALFANPIIRGAVIFFPAGSYRVTDSVKVLYPCTILGAGPLAHYAGTVGPTPVVGSYVGGASNIIQTTNNKSALVLQADGTIVEGMNIKHPGTTSTSGSGIAINAGNGTRITNNFVEGFGIDVANYAGIDAYIAFNQLANPGKYGGYQGGVIDDENGSAWLYNHFNSSAVAGITYLRIENAGGVRVIGNDAHIATGGYTGNYAAIAVDVLSGSTTGDLKIENNIFEAYTQTGIKIRQKSGTILQNGFIQGNLLNNALSGITGHDIDMKGISGGSLTRWTIQDNIISNSNSNASIYIENMSKLNLSHNQFNNTVPSQMDSLVNTTLVNDQVIGDLVVNNGKLRGGETNASNLNIQGTSGSGATGTTQAINFVDNFGVTKATFLNNGRWGFEGVTTPKSSIDALNASFGTYAGVTSAPANSIIVSGGISAGTTTAPAKFNAQLASGSEWQRVMFSSDQTFYHSFITGFSATPANSYLAIKVNNGTTNTQIEALRLRGDGTILFPPYTAANGIAHIAGTTGVLSVSPIVGADITNSTIDLTTKVTGVLPVANGGTGQSTYINGQLLIGNTTGNTLSKATLSGTQGVSITNGAGTIGIGLGAITPTSINTSGNAIFTGPNFSYTNASAGTLGPVFAAGDETHANTTWQKYDGTAAAAMYGDGHFVVGGTITLKGYTVATLPTGVVGMTAYVTDALTPTFGNILVGGGTVVAKAFYNGTNWINE